MQDFGSCYKGLYIGIGIGNGKKWHQTKWHLPWSRMKYKAVEILLLFSDFSYVERLWGHTKGAFTLALALAMAKVALEKLAHKR